MTPCSTPWKSRMRWVRLVVFLKLRSYSTDTQMPGAQKDFLIRIAWYGDGAIFVSRRQMHYRVNDQIPSLIPQGYLKRKDPDTKTLAPALMIRLAVSLLTPPSTMTSNFSCLASLHSLSDRTFSSTLL